MIKKILNQLVSDKKIKNSTDFKNLRTYIEECNDLYFNKGKPLMTDEEYDTLLKYYEDESGDLMPIGAPVTPGKKEVSIPHQFENLTGSLRKEVSIEDFKKNFFRLLPGIKENEKISIVCSLKYDGNSAAITYKNGKPVHALTRGRDGNGACLMHLFKNHRIKCNDFIGIQYEILMTYKSFDKLNETLEEKDRYINPRSAVTGITSDLNGSKYLKYLRLIPIKVIFKDKKLKRKEEFELIRDSIFNEDDKLVKNLRITEKSKSFKGSYNECVKFVKEYYEKYSTERYDLNYMIDGVVVEVNNKSYRKLGFVQNKPKWIVALKFPYQEKESTVEKFEFDIGYSGRITPCIKFTPVKFNGAVQSRVSIANYKRFMELGLGLGSKVIIQYRNEVLSYLVKKECRENERIPVFEFMRFCPTCGSKIWINDNKTYAFCRNQQCPSVMRGKIVKYIKSLNIMGIDESIIDSLLKNKLISIIPDIYSLKVADITKIERFGVKSAENIINSINKKVPFDYEILDGVGIEGIGSTFAKEVLKHYSLEDLTENVSKYEDVIKSLEGFKDKRYELLKDGIKLNKDILVKLIKTVKFNSTKDTVKILKEIDVLKFVITGDTVKFKDRAELTNFITGKGHKVIGSISKNTSYLITNDTTSGTVKNQKAKELGVPIITEIEAVEILGGI